MKKGIGDFVPRLLFPSLSLCLLNIFLVAKDVEVDAKKNSHDRFAGGWIVAL